MSASVLKQCSRIFLFLPLLCFFQLQAQPTREKIKINDNWQFAKGEWSDHPQWQAVHLPHTWNAEDVMDDEPGYYRGACWYRKSIFIPDGMRDKDLSLYFEGVNQEALVLVNGHRAGAHAGGYTGFSVNISDFVRYNADNEILVKADNRFNPNIAPLSADFSFYGGIYRDVFLVTTPKIHFATEDHASNGIYITTPQVSEGSAAVAVRAVLTNHTSAAKKIRILSRLMDRKGVGKCAVTTTIELPPFSMKEIRQQTMQVARPKLWSPENPYLYSVETKMMDETGALIDQVKNTLGFRWFSFDASKGFFLNGRPYKLVGASRHQDYKGMGNAVPDELAVQDVVLLKNMGANFLRVAHYPQDPCILRACDSLGLLASVEIPIVNEISESDSFNRQCLQMQREMIRQNFNHPSVILWCYMNEVLLKPHFSNDKERQKIYFSNIALLAQQLEDLTRREDPYRYTMMANHGNLDQYRKIGLLTIPKLVGWNLYSGWYGGSMEEFPAFLDTFHKAYPRIAFMVTEYGADADPRIRSLQPVRFDKSIEYTTRFHQFYLSEMLRRSYVAGAVVWNLADFNSETRTETMPHINNKGLLQWDRKPKDPYYYYQAMLLKKPFLKILGSCRNEYGPADSGSLFSMQAIQVASNLDSVELMLNGHREIMVKPVNGLCEARLSFRDGDNHLVARGKKKGHEYTDSFTTHFHVQPFSLRDAALPFTQLNVMLGTTRFFTDEKGQWWQPDQPYRKGAWGSVGGSRFKLSNNSRLPYGTDKNILGTDNDPVYQTQQTGIKQYRLDVPPGDYEITLHFAELLGGKVRVPPYNLSDDEREEKTKERIFNVLVNGQPMLQRFNIAREYGLATAVTKTATVLVKEGEGIVVDFEPIEGDPVLNALQLKKMNGQASNNAALQKPAARATESAGGSTGGLKNNR